MDLLVNTLLHWPEYESGPRTERVLWMSPDGEEVFCIEVFADGSLPVLRTLGELESAAQAGAVQVFIHDPYSQCATRQGEEWTQKDGARAAAVTRRDLQRRDKAWSIIEPLLEGDPPDVLCKIEGRSKLIQARASEVGCSKGAVYKYLRLFWQRGQTPNALLPDYFKCGGPGVTRKCGPETLKRGRPRTQNEEGTMPVGKNVCGEDRAIFKKAIKRYHISGDKLNLRETFDQMLSDYYDAKTVTVRGGVAPLRGPDERPSYAQFYYWVQKEITSPETVAARVGERKHRLRNRAIPTGAKRLAQGPGSVYVIDSTVGDVYLRNAKTGKIISKPTVYFALDLFSGIIVGFHVTMANDSWETAMIALDNAFEPKVEVCAQLGIEITKEQWPCEGLPQSILADRGPLEGKAATRLSDNLCIRLAQTGPYRADWKGDIERFFRSVNDALIHSLPGAVDKDHERGDHDYRLDAALDLQEFKKLVVQFILHYNEHHYMKEYPLTSEMLEDGLDPYPIDLWNWGIKNVSGKLRWMPRDVVRLNLLPNDEATVTPKGFHFNDQYYDSPDKGKYNSWYEEARTRSTWKVRIVYDPRDTERIYLWDGDNPSADVLVLNLGRSADYRGCEHAQVQSDRKERTTRRITKKEQETQGRAALNAQIAATVRGAVERSSHFEELGSKASQTRGIRANKGEEAAAERKTNAWRFDANCSAESQDGTPVSLTHSDFNPKNGRLSKYRQIIDEGAFDDD